MICTSCALRKIEVRSLRTIRARKGEQREAEGGGWPVDGREEWGACALWQPYAANTPTRDYRCAPDRKAMGLMSALVGAVGRR